MCPRSEPSAGGDTTASAAGTWHRLVAAGAALVARAAPARRSALLGAALLALLAALPLLAQPGATFSFPEDPDYLVLEYHRSHAMIDEADAEPLLRIYGDGRVRVHRHRFRVDAGDYELRLTPGELRQLLAGLAARNLPRADVAELARARRLEEDRRRAGGALFAISDDTVTRIELQLESFTPAPGARAIPNLRQRVVWANLQSDAERFPELPGIAELAAAERALRALLARPDLTRVP